MNLPVLDAGEKFVRVVGRRGVNIDLAAVQPEEIQIDVARRRAVNLQETIGCVGNVKVASWDAGLYERE